MLQNTVHCVLNDWPRLIAGLFVCLLVCILQVGLRVMNAIGIATTVLALVVWPKIRRVRSGEKVVMGSLFSGRDSPATTVTNEYEVNLTSGVLQHIHVVDRITLKKDDPLPRQLELDIFATQETLRGIADRW
jgi:hypothetical protein